MIDSFLAASGKAGFVERIIVSTTDKWNANAEDAIKGWHTRDGHVATFPRGGSDITGTILAVLAVMVAWIFGTIAMGNGLGERMSKSASQPWAPVVTAGLGTLVLMLIAGFAGMLPCFDPLVKSVLGPMGIGGVVMSWLGPRRTRPMDPTEAVIPPP